MKKLRGIVFMALLFAALLPVVACAESSDTCGDNLKWVLDDEGTLTISGTGEMWDYDENNVDGSWVTTAPWGTGIKTVVIESGVTSIGDDAFCDCGSLTRVTIPESVTSIGGSAFYKCRGLTRVTIPEGLTSIGSWAFRECSNLASVTIPDGVTCIGDGAFYNCSAIRYARMDSNGAKTLSGAGYSFREPETNYDLKYIFNGAEISGLAIYSVDDDAVSVTIPGGVTSISSRAFDDCSSLTRVTIPESVTSIGNYAFCNCSSLTSATIPESVTSIGGYAFSGCSSLTRVTIPDGVTRIADYAFTGCSNLTSVTIPEGVTGIGERAFKQCSSLTNVTIPEAVTVISSWAFDECNKLSKILVPAKVNYIGSSAIPCEATIYCYKNTKADNWATENNRSVVYLDDGITDEMRTFELSFEALSLACGESEQLTANIFPAIDVGEITWTSSNPAVASVENGLIKALAPGKTTITVTMGAFSDSAEIYVPCAEHTPATDESIEPNCTEKGLTEGSHCSVCDEILVAQEEIPALGHDLEHHDEQAPTCTEVGWDAYDACAREGCGYTTYVEIPTLGHSWLEPTYTWSDDNTSVTATRVCERDGTHAETETAQAEYVLSKAPTDAEPGERIYTASFTNPAFQAQSVSVQDIPALNDLSVLRLPADLRTIEDEAFMNLACEAVVVPEGCTAIGARAFANCKSLTYVRISASVQTIAADAFEGCDQVVIDRAD